MVVVAALCRPQWEKQLSYAPTRSEGRNKNGIVRDGSAAVDVCTTPPQVALQESALSPGLVGNRGGRSAAGGQIQARYCQARREMPGEWRQIKLACGMQSLVKM